MKSFIDHVICALKCLFEYRITRDWHAILFLRFWNFIHLQNSFQWAVDFVPEVVAHFYGRDDKTN
jgi:hypothetical protein